jgi:hypothetical protein
MDDPKYREMVQFLKDLQTDDIQHVGKSFMAHLISVFNDLRRWGADQDVCRAGLFHSIYGTQKFRRFCLPTDKRGQVRELIGDRAERIAFLNCFMDREDFDAIFIEGKSARRVINRETGDVYEVDPQDFDDLGFMHLCDWLEQVTRSQEWDYRRAGYRAMAEYYGGVALEEFDRVYAAATRDVS